jgi:hypothetical protein
MDVVASQPVMGTEMVDPRSTLNTLERWFFDSKLLCSPAVRRAEGMPEALKQIRI